jgi:predicted nucleic acid-binding protein
VKVLLDTCVISEIAHPKGTKRVRERVATLRSVDTFLSVVTIGEITNGIARLARGRKRKALEAFLLHLEQDFESRILGVDLEAARIWGETTAAARQHGKTVPPTDGLIAATAIRHGLHIMSRNVSDFEGTGARIINPWDDA